MEMRVRAALGVIASTVILGGALAAQTKIPGIPSGTQLNPGAVAGNGNYIVIGCVSRQDNAANFFITDPRPTPPVQYRLVADVDLLRFHVGHTVEISGPIATAGAAKTLTVKSLTYVSMTCQKPAVR